LCLTRADFFYLKSPFNSKTPDKPSSSCVSATCIGKKEQKNKMQLREGNKSCVTIRQLCATVCMHRFKNKNDAKKKFSITIIDRSQERKEGGEERSMRERCDRRSNTTCTSQHVSLKATFSSSLTIYFSSQVWKEKSE
jgi:hypothetical protein